jgi:apolipoprotein N-acyltransferase
MVPIEGEQPLPVGVPICFEDAFSGVVGEMVRSGARVLVNLTNNSWSRRESAQIQHLAAARFRSIEYRIALARSTNSGVTTLVDIFGRQTHSLPMFEAGSRYVSLPIYAEAGHTPYTLLGPWLPTVALLGTALLLVVDLRRRGASRIGRQ